MWQHDCAIVKPDLSTRYTFNVARTFVNQKKDKERKKETKDILDMKTEGLQRRKVLAPASFQSGLELESGTAVADWLNGSSFTLMVSLTCLCLGLVRALAVIHDLSGPSYVAFWSFIFHYIGFSYILLWIYYFLWVLTGDSSAKPVWNLINLRWKKKRVWFCQSTHGSSDSYLTYWQKKNFHANRPEKALLFVKNIASSKMICLSSIAVFLIYRPDEINCSEFA